MGLLERDHELAQLRERLRRAGNGQGSAIAVAGDSGTGKSALLETALAAVPRLRIMRGACDPLRTPRPLGPFRDVARDAGLGPLLHADELLSQVCEELYEALRSTPTALVVEDLHWVDAASVEVLRFLVRRVEAMPLALLISYRDSEIDPRHAARPLLGDFARLDGLDTIQLAPLSVGAVQSLTAGTRLDAARVHALTGGNPFFVTEVAKEPDRPLPASVRDAVLARTAEVAPEDFEVLQLVAAAPDRLDDRLLPALGVDLPTLRRLDGTGLLTRSRGGLVFRHELARQALESTIPPGGPARLHARLLDALERIEPLEPAVLTHHAVAAGDSPRAARYAQDAAREAVQAGSHTEAAAFFATALEHLPRATPAERARLLQQLSFEQYMISRLAEAIENVRATFPLWQQAGDPAGLAGAYETCAVYEYYNARRREAESQVERAASIAGDSGSEVAYAAARATHGLFAYMGSDLELARACAADAEQIAGAHDKPAIRLKGQLVASLASTASGDAGARGRLADRIEAARSSALDELASTGYSHLAWLDVEQRRLRAAELVLAESLPFTVERDIPICNHWQTGVRSRLQLALGRWQAAVEDAERVLETGGMPLARLWPHLVTGLVPLRQGKGAPAATAALEQAWQLARQVNEPLRRMPVLSGLAELMWMTGQPDSRVTDDAVRELELAADLSGSEWSSGELAVWLHRLGLLDQAPGPVAEPFRLSLAGRATEAASWWRQAGEPFAEAMALGDSDAVADRARGVELLDELGAIGTADRRRSDLRREGVAKVPQRPRTSTRANPAGLTNRQLDVARLVARGFTNAEIAGRLYISAKTADHHVSAVLMKMGLPNRRAVVVRAGELGLV